LFVAVTAAERGLLGSDFLLAHLPMPTRALVANINIDMPLAFGPTRDVIAFGAQHSSLGNNALSAASAYGYRLSPDPNPSQMALLRNDQFSFIRRGIPAIALQSGNHSRERNIDVAALKQEFEERHYHQPSDDLSLPMDFEMAADLTRLNRKIAQDIANTPQRPRWRPGDFFAKTFGKN
jgi:Zn-dependent M28 family amino/carboxypeptidase